MTKLIILGAMAATPLFAQIPNRLTFTTSFPFYVGNQYMPAGSYIVTEPVANSHSLLVRDAHYTRGLFIRYNPTQTLTPVYQSMASFREYGGVAFLASLSVTGDPSGIELLRSKREKQTALTEHEQASNNSVPLTAVRAGN
jgi:hypothetical protein